MRWRESCNGLVKKPGQTTWQGLAGPKEWWERTFVASVFCLSGFVLSPLILSVFPLSVPLFWVAHSIPSSIFFSIASPFSFLSLLLDFLFTSSPPYLLCLSVSLSPFPSVSSESKPNCLGSGACWGPQESFDFRCSMVQSGHLLMSEKMVLNTLQNQIWVIFLYRFKPQINFDTDFFFQSVQSIRSFYSNEYKNMKDTYFSHNWLLREQEL